MREFDELKFLKEFKARMGWSYDRIARVQAYTAGQSRAGFWERIYLSPMAKKVLRAFLIEHL